MDYLKEIFPAGFTVLPFLNIEEIVSRKRSDILSFFLFTMFAATNGMIALMRASTSF
jgi:hypothetical protein